MRRAVTLQINRSSFPGKQEVSDTTESEADESSEEEEEDGNSDEVPPNQFVVEKLLKMRVSVGIHFAILSE